MSETTLPRSPAPADRTFEDLSWLDELLAEALLPEPSLTVSTWADEYRILPSTSAEPGRWRTARTPYLKEPMDVLSSSHPAEVVVVMKGSQIGGTEIGNNWIGFIIHHAPGLLLNVQPTLQMAHRNTTTRINPLIESTPVLRERVAPPRSRDSGNSIYRKKFPGGELAITGANSAAGLRSTPARYLFLDEIDAYPPDADGEGDPVDLALRRTSTFRGRRKIYMVSTPTNRGASRIEKAYLESDQRRYYVPCRACGHYAVITFDKLRFDKDDSDATARRAYNVRYVCSECGQEHSEADKTSWLLPNGQWRPTATGDGRTVGFHLSALYSPFEPWEEICTQFLRVKDDPERFRVWWNTALGETWEVQGEAPEWERLYERRESYKIGRVPPGPLVLTAGVDVQADRLEAEVVGWGPDNQSWSIDYRIFLGNTSDIDSPVWKELSEFLNEPFPAVTGPDRAIERLAIDDGFNSQIVRSWARGHSASRVMVVKGVDRAPAPLGLPSYVDVNTRGKRIRRGMRIWPIGSSLLKSQLYGWLKLNKPEDGQPYPSGYCHFPQYNREYFEQLTAERITKKVVRGYVQFEWVKTRDRNEALDCRLYARAAALALGIERWRASHWKERAEQYGQTVEVADVPAAPATAPATVPSRPRPVRRRVLRSPYMDRR